MATTVTLGVSSISQYAYTHRYYISSTQYTEHDVYTDQYNSCESGVFAQTMPVGMVRNRLYFQFDISSLPVGVTITSAKLGLYYYADGNPPTGDSYAKRQSIHKVLDGWSLSSLAIDDAGFESNVIDYSDFPLQPAWIEFEVKDTLQQMLSGAIPNNGWVIRSNNEEYSTINVGARFYRNVNYADTALRPKLTVIYEYVNPDAPTPIEPIGLFKDPSNSVRFAWTYNSPVGGTQKAFDLQWSTDQTNWSTVSQTTVNNYYDMPTNTLPTGNIYWRVRCYNVYDAAGVYCAIQAFYAIGAPTAPIINAVPTNSARPIVTWSAFNQQLYQLQILSGSTVVYDSGDKPSISVRSHKITTFLVDGTYKAKLRIKNEYDLWSAWGESTFTISTAKPDMPSLIVTKTTYGLQAKASVKDVDKMLLYRDGVCVQQQAVKSISDNLVRNGNCEEGVSYWTPQDSNILITVEGEKFKVTATTGYKRVISQNFAVKPNTNYYIKYNCSNFGNAAHARVRADSGNVDLTYGPGTFNTGTYSSIDIMLLFLSAGTAYFDSIMLVEGTTTPAAYKSYSEDYIIADNATENGKQHGYVARAVQEIPEGEVYNDSDPVISTASIKNSLIHPVSDPDAVFAITRSLNTPMKRSYERNQNSIGVLYAGRTYPVTEQSEHISAGISLTFYLKTYAEVEAFTALCDRKETVLYRDTHGRKMYGTLGGLSVNDERTGFTVNCTISQVDYAEELEV